MAAYHDFRTTALLDLLEKPESAEVWREIDSRYRPIVIGFARRLGLSLEDAEDAAQETLLRFSKACAEGRHDPAKGRLRSYVLGIAHQCIAGVLSSRRGLSDRRGDSILGEIPAPDAMERLWDEEHHRVISRRAMNELKSGTRFDAKTVRAFELIVIEKTPAGDVAEMLGMSLDSIYAAKHRCTRELRRIVAGLEKAYEMVE